MSSWFLIKDKIMMVLSIQNVPNHSEIPKGTFNQITAIKAAASGSAHANRLVSVAVLYLRLSK